MGRRYKKLSITLQIVKAEAQKDTIELKNLNPLPSDVRIVNAYIESRSGIPDDWDVLHIILESETFDKVAEDADVPMYEMPFERLPEREYPTIVDERPVILGDQNGLYEIPRIE